MLEKDHLKTTMATHQSTPLVDHPTESPAPAELPLEQSDEALSLEERLQVAVALLQC